MKAKIQDDKTYGEIVGFLNAEAMLLDEYEFQEWFEEVPAEDITYRVPTRVTQERKAGNEFSEESFHYVDDYKSLATRVDRLESEYAWAINPPPRMRRFVSNVIIEQDGDEFEVKDYVLTVRNARDKRTPEMLSAKRISTLRQLDEGFELAEREVKIDQTAVSFDHVPLL